MAHCVSFSRAKISLYSSFQADKTTHRSFSMILRKVLLATLLISIGVSFIFCYILPNLQLSPLLLANAAINNLKLQSKDRHICNSILTSYIMNFEMMLHGKIRQGFQKVHLVKLTHLLSLTHTHIFELKFFLRLHHFKRRQEEVIAKFLLIWQGKSRSLPARAYLSLISTFCVKC